MYNSDIGSVSWIQHRGDFEERFKLVLAGLRGKGKQPAC